MNINIIYEDVLCNIFIPSTYKKYTVHIYVHNDGRIKIAFYYYNKHKYVSNDITILFL